MQIAGKWLRFNDGIYRPVVRRWVLDGIGRLVADEFLVDIGADQTVFSAALLAKLALPESENRSLPLRALYVKANQDAILWALIIVFAAIS